jgi:hypothetical protein
VRVIRLDKETILFGIRCFLLSSVVAVALVLGLASAEASGPLTENVYVDGQTYAINTGAAVIFDASDGLLNHASPMYLIGFSVVPGTTGLITLPSGYQPQNNGLPSPVPYHDHVLTGAPGLGTSGTAGDYGAPLRIVMMRYTLAYTYDPAFVPVTSVDQIAAAEAAGKFQVINAGATDPFQLWTTTILVRPILSQSK